MLAIEVQNLSRHFQTGRNSTEDLLVLKDINLKISQGECVAILGLNGAGKTTLFRILNTLILPTQGQVKILEQDIIAQPEFGRNVVAWSSGQEGGFFNRFTGLENLLCFATMDGVSKAEVLARIEKFRQMKPFEQALETPYYLCSAGMKQVLSFVSAIITEKPVLILDEPTRSLDKDTAGAVRNIIAGLKADRTILFSTHREEDLSIADQVYRLEDGCLTKLNL